MATVVLSAVGAAVGGSLGGTVFGDSARIVLINDFRIEVLPEGTLLVCTNFDRPGAVGKVGTILGKANINISAMQLSRVGQDGLAMFVLTLDQTPPADIIAELEQLDVLDSIQIVSMTEVPLAEATKLDSLESDSVELEA